jgi:hypothetical protein
MALTISSFSKRQEEWMKRAESSADEGKIGHQSYALAQAEMWKSLKNEAERKFNGCKFEL